MTEWARRLRNPAVWHLLAVALPFWTGSLLFAQGFDLRDGGWWLLGAESARGLHENLQLEEASGRFLLLHPFLSVLGSSARSLVWLQSALSGAMGGIVFALLWRAGRRNGAWLGLLAVLAFGWPPPWVLPPLLLILALELRKPALRASAVALAFPFGIASVGLCALFAILALPRRAGWQGRRWPWVGLGGGVLLFLLCAWIAGGIAAEFRAGWQEPLERTTDALASGAAGGWWKSVRSGPFLRLPFAELRTGEDLQPLFGGHGTTRLWSFRALYLLVFAAAAAAIIRAAFRRRGGIGLALCVGAGVMLLPRGDLIQLRAALLVAIPGWLLLAQHLAKARWVPILLALPIVLPLAERGWLLLNHYRDGLLFWDRERAEILLDAATVSEFELLDEALPGPGEALLAWPNAAGIHWLLGRPPATRFVRQPREDRSDEIIAELRRSGSASVLLGPDCLRGASSLVVRQSGLHDYLRTHYQIVGSASLLDQRFRMLAALPEGSSVDQLALAQRLPVAEMGVATDAAPALRKGLAIGQSFRMGSSDFQGFSLRWQSERVGVTVPLRFHLWLNEGGSYDTLLHFFDADIDISESGARSYLRVGPLPDTAGRELALSFNLREDIDFDLSPLWHRQDATETSVDFYPLGSAMINDKEVAADLYFAIY